MVLKEIMAHSYLYPTKPGKLNPNDTCPRLNAIGDHVDDDGDGVGNLCDNCPKNYNALQNGKQVCPERPFAGHSGPRLLKSIHF